MKPNCGKKEEGTVDNNSLENFLESGPPPIAICLGAMSFESTEEKAKLDTIVRAVNNAGMRAVIQGFNKTLENYNLPENMISIGSIPHSYLFKHVYCVVHHGGFGTTASVIRAGVPSIVIPHALDQYFWADKVHELKLGPKPVSSKQLSGESLTRAIGELKGSCAEITESVREISERVKMEDGLARSVELIKRY